MTDKEKKELFSHPWAFYTEPFRIAGNLYFVGNMDVGAYLINTEEGLVLIDSTYPSTAPLLIQSITALNFSVKNVKYLLHTHGHFDHFGIRDFCPFTPDVLLDGGEIITSGRTAIKVVATPGHSDGCMSFFFDVEEDGVKYRCGLFGGAGFNTLTDDFIAKYGNVWSRREYMQTLDKLSNEHVDIMLGNHTSQAKMLEKHIKATKYGTYSPFVDKDEFGCFIKERTVRFLHEFGLE